MAAKATTPQRPRRGPRVVCLGCFRESVARHAADAAPSSAWRCPHCGWPSAVVVDTACD